MENSFLYGINQGIKEKELVTPMFNFPFERFPNCIKNAITFTVHNKMPKDQKQFLTPDKYCEFFYDNNGNLMILVSFNKEKVYAIIVDNKDVQVEFPNEDFLFYEDTNAYKIPISSVIDSASWFEVKYRLIKDVNKELEGLPISNRDIENVSRNIANRIMTNHNLVTFQDRFGINRLLNKLVPVVLEYANYMNDQYLTHTSNLKITKYYTPIESPTMLSRGKKGPSGESIGRKNELIPMEERDEILMSLGPTYTMQLISTTNDAHYNCYLYPMGEDEYKMIAEPLSGDRYTKVFHFQTIDIERDRVLDEATSKYIPLTDAQTLSSDYCYRIGHTSKEVYEASVSYAITLNNKFNPKEYTRLNALTTTPDVLIPSEELEESPNLT